jgi:hypothetical protein
MTGFPEVCSRACGTPVIGRLKQVGPDERPSLPRAESSGFERPKETVPRQQQLSVARRAGWTFTCLVGLSRPEEIERLVVEWGQLPVIWS